MNFKSVRSQRRVKIEPQAMKIGRYFPSLDPPRPTADGGLRMVTFGLPPRGSA